MFLKSSTITFLLVVEVTLVLGAPQYSYPNQQRPAYNQGGLLPSVGAVVGDLTTGLNGALGGRPTYVSQGYNNNVPAQQMQAYQPFRRGARE